jgi:putative NADPH-quinone reductase
VLFYPLWLGTLPALLKAFFEQLFRPEYAIHMDAETGHWERLLKGKSARVVVTMGMPGFAYRLFYRAHSLKSLERNILKFVGIKPVRETVIGLVESPNHNHGRDIERMRKLGARGR